MTTQKVLFQITTQGSVPSQIQERYVAITLGDGWDWENEPDDEATGKLKKRLDWSKIGDHAISYALALDVRTGAIIRYKYDGKYVVRDEELAFWVDELRRMAS